MLGYDVSHLINIPRFTKGDIKWPALPLTVRWDSISSRALLPACPKRARPRAIGRASPSAIGEVVYI